jgi:hypothetical protein
MNKRYLEALEEEKVLSTKIMELKSLEKQVNEETGEEYGSYLYSNKINLLELKLNKVKREIKDWESF